MLMMVLVLLVLIVIVVLVRKSVVVALVLAGESAASSAPARQCEPGVWESFDADVGVSAVGDRDFGTRVGGGGAGAGGAWPPASGVAVMPNSQRKHILPMAHHRAPEELAFEVYTLKQQVSSLVEDNKLANTDRRRLENALVQMRGNVSKAEELLNNRERATSPNKGLSQMYRSPDTSALIPALKDKNRQLQAENKALLEEMMSAKSSVRSTKVTEIQVELDTYRDELVRQGQINGELLMRLQQAEEAAAASAEEARLLVPGHCDLDSFTQAAEAKPISAGAPAVLRYLRSHMKKLQYELRGTPGGEPVSNLDNEEQYAGVSVSTLVEAMQELVEELRAITPDQFDHRDSAHDLEVLGEYDETTPHSPPHCGGLEEIKEIEAEEGAALKEEADNKSEASPPSVSSEIEENEAEETAALREEADNMSEASPPSVASVKSSKSSRSNRSSKSSTKPSQSAASATAKAEQAAASAAKAADAAKEAAARAEEVHTESYKVMVKTANEDNAATQCNAVYLQLIGVNEKMSAEVALPKQDMGSSLTGNLPNFERGSMNTFVKDFKAGFGVIIYANLRVEASPGVVGQDWGLNRIYITNQATTQTWVSDAPTWLGPVHGLTKRVTMQAFDGPAPSSSGGAEDAAAATATQVAGAEFQVVVKTADEPTASTTARSVFITLVGAGEKLSGESSLERFGSGTVKFERGAVNEFSVTVPAAADLGDLVAVDVRVNDADGETGLDWGLDQIVITSKANKMSFSSAGAEWLGPAYGLSKRVALIPSDSPMPSPSKRAAPAPPAPSSVAGSTISPGNVAGSTAAASATSSPSKTDVEETSGTADAVAEEEVSSEDPENADLKDAEAWFTSVMPDDDLNSAAYSVYNSLDGRTADSSKGGFEDVSSVLHQSEASMVSLMEASERFKESGL
eukprot:gene2709-12578_t